MANQNDGKLNWLTHNLPEGLLVDATWMERKGYSTSLRSQYVAAGWLVQPARGTYKRPLGELTWQKVVISLQTLLGHPLIVGARTALELRGIRHYVSPEEPLVIHLYGLEPPPGWLSKLPLKQEFRFHRSATLFKNDPVTKGLTNLSWNVERNTGQVTDELRTSGYEQLWGPNDWPLTLSTPERAYLEMLSQIPQQESFDLADKLMEGMTTLRPKMLQKLLVDCKSIKVRRLFFFFADRQNHPWLKRLDRDAIDLGTGKRMLVRGGKLDPKYLITVPGNLDAPV
jgi:hypothetical protein